MSFKLKNLHQVSQALGESLEIVDNIFYMGQLRTGCSIRKLADADKGICMVMKG